MMTSSRPPSSIEVVGVRYRGSTPAPDDERCLDAYVADAVYWRTGAQVVYGEPTLPAAQVSDDRPTALGQIGAVVADAVAQGRRAGRPVLVTGGDCSHAVGVFGGLQRAHGPAARIGLVWLDAHGDFNTPRTTLSGMLGGMPVAVCAGLAHPAWRELAGLAAPVPTDRMVLADLRNLDQPEELLIRATDAVIAALEPGRPGADFGLAVAALAARCELLYLHVDSDILDASLVPNHGTREPGGPDLPTVAAAIDLVMATGKVGAFAVVSVYGAGEGRDTSLASGVALIEAGLQGWQRHGAG
jgi:arginase